VRLAVFADRRVPQVHRPPLSAAKPPSATG
jgi:hypothetical protein